MKKKQNQNDIHWECIYRSRHSYQAEILKALLEESEINSIIVNKQDSAYFIGEYEVYINRDDILRAEKILNNFLQGE